MGNPVPIASAVSSSNWRADYGMNPRQRRKRATVKSTLYRPVKKGGAGRLSDKLNQLVNFGGGKVRAANVRYVTLHANGSITGIIYNTNGKAWRVRLKDNRYKLWTVDGLYKPDNK